MRGTLHPAGRKRSILTFASIAVCALGCLALWGCPITPQPVKGPDPGTLAGRATNAQPTLSIVRPSSDIAINAGTPVTIEWIAEDPDDDPLISIELDTDAIVGNGNELPVLVNRPLSQGTSFELNTTGIPSDGYLIRASANDGVNPVVYAVAPGMLIITPPGSAPLNAPPTIIFTEPLVNMSVVHGDQVTLAWNDADPDDNAQITLMLDLDQDPTNDDYTNRNDPGLIILTPPPPATTITPLLEDPEGQADQHTFTINILHMPIRPSGEPYYIRATIDDGINPPVHRYAPGRIYVTGMAGGTVDLGKVGKTITGATWLGFNPGARCGSRMIPAMDIAPVIQEGEGEDAVIRPDGVDDFVLVAQFGVPRNMGNFGEAYLVFGQDHRRFGGTINVNDVTLNYIRGFTFEGHEIVDPASVEPNQEAFTNGITDVVAVPDLTGDKLPELFFGQSHVDGVQNARDDDPGDNGGQFYPDPFANNWHCTQADCDSVPFESIGSVMMVNSQNIAPGGLLGGIINLMFAGQHPAGGYAGTRFQVTLFDNPYYWGNEQGYPFDRVDALFGQNVDWLPDTDGDNDAEIIISAPRNELDIAELRDNFPDYLPAICVTDQGTFEYLLAHPHLASRPYSGNVIVILGENFSTITDDCGNSVIPYLVKDKGACCGDDGGGSRALATSTLWFEIRGEKPTDQLGGARKAGDVNLDGKPDLVMGAPYADPDDITDAGTAYILFGRKIGHTFGPLGWIMTIDLADANPGSGQLRPPMVRIFGTSPDDHLGLRQELAAQVDVQNVVQKDFNGDNMADVVIASKDYDVGGLVDAGFVGVVFGGQLADGDFSVNQLATPQLHGVRFFGANAGDLAGADIASGGDFNGDGYVDLLIAAPGARRQLGGVLRKGVVYLIFGGLHLQDQTFTLDQVGAGLPGIVFVSPYQEGTVDEAAPTAVGFVGDVDNDGFDDIMIGNPDADFVNPDEPSQRRFDAGEAYLIYGNNWAG